MKQLDLALSNQIEGTFKTQTTERNTTFYLNKNFVVDELLINGRLSLFKKTDSNKNYRIYSLSSEINDIIEIKYHGILDGSTGAYPYVREKTCDEFYLLREETKYYPVLLHPESVEYIDHIINPQLDDYFKVTIDMFEDRNIITNLTKNDNFFTGFNPTFAVGYFERLDIECGVVYYSKNQKETIAYVEKTVNEVQAYMNQYLMAQIKDFQFIIIPSGYGSFVLPGTIFLDEKALTSPQYLIHEMIHVEWNPKIEKECQRTRFFDEALTQYFTMRIMDALHIQKAAVTEQQYFKESREQTRDFIDEVPPLSLWGKNELGDLSYSLGALILMRLEQHLGKYQMDELLQQLLNDFRESEVTFEKFINLIPGGSGKEFFKQITFNRIIDL